MKPDCKLCGAPLVQIGNEPDYDFRARVSCLPTCIIPAAPHGSRVNTSALTPTVPAGAGETVSHARLPNPFSPQSSDHALGGLSDSYEFVPNHEDAR